MAQLQYSRVHRMMPVLSGLVIFLLLMSGIASLGYQGRLLAKNQIATSGLLQAAPIGNLDITKQEPVKSEILMDEKPEPNMLPPDVEAWLNHLQKIEKKRGKLAMDQVSSAMVTMTRMQLAGAASQLESALGGAESIDDDSLGENTPAAGLREDFAKQRQNWKDLLIDFNALAAPAECTPTKAAYEAALRETSAMMGDLLGVLESSTDGSASSDELIKKLNGMKGTSKTIDEAGKLTDERVQEICDKYKVKKWFSISSDFGGGGLLSGRF